MEEYLQYMKTLRSQMNDVEDHAAKISVEEQMQITTIQTLQKDLDLAKSEITRLKEDTDLLVKTKGHTCSQILEKQRKMAALESDSSTLSQTLELIQREIVSLSGKLEEKSTYYTKVAEDINSKLQEHQEWINSNKFCSKAKDKVDEKTSDEEGLAGKCTVESHLDTDSMGDVEKDLMTNLDAANAKFELVIEMKSKLVSDSTKVMQSVELVKCKINDFEPELREMDRETLEDELQALSSDKAGETDYLQTLQRQIETLKGISHMVNCACGEEYKVEVVDLCG